MNEEDEAYTDLFDIIGDEEEEEGEGLARDYHHQDFEEDTKFRNKILSGHEGRRHLLANEQRFLQANESINLSNATIELVNATNVT